MFAPLRFLRLKDPLLKVLFENDELLAIDKPYGFNTHTNDSKTEFNEDIQDGLIEIFIKQFDRPLYVIHRLDQTTTGVLVFSKTPESAKKYSSYFFDRLVKKTYLFVTDKSISDAEKTVNSDIIHKGKSLSAATHFTHLKTASDLNLWQAEPHSGRNHQIRIHAKEAGLSILGDTLYSGSAYPFLSLHNSQIEFPNGVRIESRCPVYFSNLELYKNHFLSVALFEIDRRQRLYNFSLNDEQALRLSHRKNQERFGGYNLDLYGSHALLSWYREDWSKADLENFNQIAISLNRPLIVRQMINRGKDSIQQQRLVLNPEPTLNAKNCWQFQEGDLKFLAKSDSGQSLGLFLDQRLQRTWVNNHSEQKSVLNLFSYTCAFSVAAAVGKAVQVTSVDTNKNFLNWGKENFALNSIDAQKFLFFCRDSQTFIKQSLQKGQSYDIIVCDPPSFSRSELGVFKIEEQIVDLITSCLKILKPGGKLLFSTNSETLRRLDVYDRIIEATQKVSPSQFEVLAIESALDFETPQESALLKSFLISHITS